MEGRRDCHQRKARGVSSDSASFGHHALQFGGGADARRQSAAATTAGGGKTGAAGWASPPYQGRGTIEGHMIQRAVPQFCGMRQMPAPLWGLAAEGVAAGFFAADLFDEAGFQ